MSATLQFFGATGEVTGSQYLLRTDRHAVLLECGLIQGSPDNEKRNREPFPFSIDELDSVILSHAHIDHSGRVPLLWREGYRGRVHVHQRESRIEQQHRGGHVIQRGPVEVTRHRGGW